MECILSTVSGIVIPFFIHTDDLASKANILIDPAELQAVTMDDLDEDEESVLSTAQVSLVMLHGIGQGLTKVTL